MRAKITLLASLMIFISFSGIFCVKAWPSTIEEEVPNVVGFTQAAAASALTSINLSVGSVASEYSSTIAAGYVISQSPAAGTFVALGTSIDLLISLGPPVSPPVTVPNVVGATQAAAASALTAAGLSVGTVNTQNSSTIAAGDVISESPAAGASVNSGSSVNLVISLGPAPISCVYVYDTLNRLTDVECADGTGVQYTYDAVGNVTSETYYNGSFPITVVSGTGGTVSPSSTNVVNGGSQTFTITPNTGYQVSDVLVDGADQGAITSYTFTNVSAPHTISVTFDTGTFTITASAGPNGSISPSGAVTVNSGASQTFTITPGAGYYADVLVDGADQGAITSYTFSNVTEAHTISATFAAAFYAITTTAGSNGSISPSGPVTVNSGANQTFTISPNTGYQVADVLVDGADQGAITSYTFNNVTSAHTISATFAAASYTITATAGPNGSISPSVPVTVNSGASQTFTITPNTYYYITDVQIDGVSNGPMASYTFSNVYSNHTLSATFANCTIINASTNACYTSVQDAYNNASNGDSILCTSGYLTQTLVADLGISVTIDGGYTSNFSSNPGASDISGPITINNGTVLLKNYIIEVLLFQ